MSGLLGLPNPPTAIDFDGLREGNVDGVVELWDRNAPHVRAVRDAEPVADSTQVVTPEEVFIDPYIPVLHKAMYDYLVWLVRIQILITGQLNVGAVETTGFVGKTLEIPGIVVSDQITYIRNLQAYALSLASNIPKYYSKWREDLLALASYFGSIAGSFGNGGKPGQPGTMDTGLLRAQEVPWGVFKGLCFPEALMNYVLQFQTCPDQEGILGYHDVEV